MRIRQIPIFNDNYTYLLIDDESGTAATIDPAEPEPVLAAIEEEGVELTHILCTHHHWDHTGGNEKVLERWPDAEVTGGRIDADKIDGITRRLEDGDEVEIGSNIVARVLFTPCHTNGHISYLVDDALFCGDVLFVGGCGRFFEGDAEDMHRSLNEVIAELPGDTRVYCGHEYTVSNLEFARSVDPDNEALQSKLEWARKRVADGEPTVPSTVAEELEYNPFMRVDQPVIQEAVGGEDPVDTMAKLRKAKNDF